MKKTIIPFIIILLSSANVFSQNPKLTLTEFEAATVTFKETVEQASIFVSKTVTAHLKNFGKSLAQYIEEERDIKMLNKKETSRMHTIMDGDYIISIDLIKMTGKKMPNIAKDFFGNMDNKDAGQFGQEIKDMMKAETKEIGKMTIDDKVCIKYLTTANMMGIVTESIECKYKGYNLYEESNAMGVKTTKIVTSFREGDPGPASAWKPEPGVKIQEVSISY